MMRMMTTRPNTTTARKNVPDDLPQKPTNNVTVGSFPTMRVTLLLLLSFLASLLAYTCFWTSRGDGSAGWVIRNGPSSASSSFFVSWHIKPIKPHHHGDVIFLTERREDNTLVYKREFTVPCGDGILVFNIGPALENQPYSYDIYQDNYAYSDNSGLCVLYPSYKGEQTADFPLWGLGDPTQQTIALGDVPNKISTRIVEMARSKKFDATKRGGDFCIMRSGNFYTPEYYKQLKHEINTWPESIADIPLALVEAIQRVDEAMLQQQSSPGRNRNNMVRGGASQLS